MKETITRISEDLQALSKRYIREWLSTTVSAGRPRLHAVMATFKSIKLQSREMTVM